MITRTIKTNLLGKEDIFKMLAVAEATKMPVLFLGVPGVGKTQALLDYAAAMFNYDRAEVRKHAYILETDEGTRTSEIKGRVNMAKLLEDKKYEVDAPIANAHYILINEIDKGSSGVRNTLLSVMRERALFYGDDIKKCAWKLFASSCNEIPEDEKDSPFWDRFIMKYQVERVGAGKVEEMWDCVYSGTKCTVDVNIPTKQELIDCQFSNDHLIKFTSMIYEIASDRTLAQVPHLCKAIKLVYGCADIKALMLCATMICPERIAEISQELEDSRIVELKTLIEDIHNLDHEDNEDYIGDNLNNITTKLEALRACGEFDDDTINELNNEVNMLLGDSSMAKIWEDWGKANGVPQIEVVESATNGELVTETIEDDDDIF